MATSSRTNNLLSQPASKASASAPQSTPVGIATIHDRRWSHFQVLWAASCLVLVGATWRLWTPQEVFPEVPLLQVFCNAPSWFDWIGLASLIITLATAIVTTASQRQSARRISALLVTASLIWLILMNQHRIQPWAYQFALLGVVFCLASSSTGMRLARWLAISIYLFSALGKFDYQFLHTVGPQMLGKALHFAGTDTSSWSAAQQAWSAIALPLGELAIVLMLCYVPTRRLGAWVAVLAHVALLLVLGPLGLKHAWGVLLWNIFFIAQALMLFLPKLEIRATRMAITDYIATGLVMVILVLPCGEIFGFYDHWPSWGLYSPRNSRVTVNVLTGKLANDIPITKYATTDEAEMWSSIDIGRWSLDSLGVPIYPQDRFQLGVAIAVAQSTPGGAVRVEVQSMSSRFDGMRTTRQAMGLDALEKEASDFRFNALPRNPRRVPTEK